MRPGKTDTYIMARLHDLFVTWFTIERSKTVICCIRGPMPAGRDVIDECFSEALVGDCYVKMLM